MTQTWALLTDMYRELNSKKLFWITLIISGLFIITFGLVGADATGLKLLWFHFDVPMAAYVYKSVFSWIIAGFWLTWVAAILALISTAGIFPEFLAGGSVELYFAKPIGRGRLFLTKYLCGLLFVLAQVVPFCVGSFIVFGLRAGEWKPSLFLGIPLTLCFFSYIYAVCVLIGVATRSTLAALLLAILAWGFFFSLHFSEQAFLKRMHVNEIYLADYDSEAKTADERLTRLESSSMTATQPYTDVVRQQRDKARSSAAAARSTLHTWTVAHRFAYVAYVLLPKTTETTDMLDRWLFNNTEIEERETQQESGIGAFFQDPEFRRMQLADVKAEHQTIMELRARRPIWIIGTSLTFEVVVVLLAGWLFCRRDY